MSDFQLYLLALPVALCIGAGYMAGSRCRTRIEPTTGNKRIAHLSELVCLLLTAGLLVTSFFLRSVPLLLLAAYFMFFAWTFFSALAGGITRDTWGKGDDTSH